MLFNSEEPRTNAGYHTNHKKKPLNALDWMRAILYPVSNPKKPLLTGLSSYVTGLDGSEELLRYAKANAPEARFVLDDARSFRLSSDVDAVICLNDSLT